MAQTGTVKWFIQRRALVSSSLMTAAKTSLSIFTAVERSGMDTLQEGQKIEFELETDRRSGKPSAVNLKPAG